MLVAIGRAQFSGTTDEGRPRLQFGPDASDHRRGGIWLVMEFNGDELATVPLKKVALDRQMRDAYKAFYAAACDELAQIDLATYQRATVKVSQMGKVESLPGVVFKTRLQRDAANEIDWANKEDLDFNDIWDTLLLNPAWRKEHAELKQDE